MADGFVWNLASKALELAATAAVKEAASWWGVRDDLEKLEDTIRTNRARVRDAERCQEGDSSEMMKDWLRRLKKVLYRAEDLFEKVLYVDHQKKQLMERSMLCKVGILFSKYGPLYHNRKLADEIKSIRLQLDVIKSDINGLPSISLPAEERRPTARLIEKRETVSFVDAQHVTGREDDQSKIIDMLLDPKYDSESITVISIVGFGGLGKTTLAQLVFNHQNVKQHFDLTAWAYVPDTDDVKLIKRKIFHAFPTDNDNDVKKEKEKKSDHQDHKLDDIERGIRETIASKKNDHQNPTLNDIERGIRETIASKKYLLVLDDLWIEGADIIELRDLLKGGKPGSKVIVTSRLDVVTKGFGNVAVPYRLDFLTEGQSWILFKRLAFGTEEEDINNPDLITIGKDIVKMCGNVPLAIKVVGGFLYSKDRKEEWKQVKTDLSNAQLAESDKIISVLKLSYEHLLPKTKLCFAYCSLFPKGYEFQKDDLVHLWIAQGYVEPDKGDQYFWDLVARNLFQGFKVSDEKDVTTYKMHDLLHDLASEVAGDEIKLLGYDGDESLVRIPNELIHVNLRPESKQPPSLKVARRLRSLLGITYNAKDEKFLLKNKSLRVLSMEYDDCNKLPNSIRRLIHLRYLKLGKSRDIKYLPDWIGRLIHLRYLDLGRNQIKYLPDCIAQLKNLQALKLEGSKLRELPRDFVKLTNLKHLLLPDTLYSLTDLPPNFGEMQSLQELNKFIVGKSNGLDSLRACWNHRGSLDITFCKWRTDAIGEASRLNLEVNHQLVSLTLNLGFIEEGVSPDVGKMNEMMKCLQLSPKLEELFVWDYKGDELPCRWFDGLSHRLVFIGIYGCRKCKVLPDLSRLPFLKRLELIWLPKLEYVEDENNMRCGSSIQNGYFQSLEILELRECIKLKGWTRPNRASEDNVGGGLQLVFPSLLEMKVEACRMLMSMPLAPKLESLIYKTSNGKALKCIMGSNHEEEGPSSLSAPPSSLTVFLPLKELEIHRVLDEEEISSLAFSSRCCNLNTLLIDGWSGLRSIRVEYLNSLQTLDILDCKDLEMEEDEEEEEEEEEEGGKSSRGWQDLTSLRQLTLFRLPRMKKIPSGIIGLTTIEKLRIASMENLTEIPDEIGKLSLLRQLEIENCPKLNKVPGIFCLTTIEELSIKEMKNLIEIPEEISNLSLLRKLEIERCPKLESLPTSIQGLTSLQYLRIKGCPELAARRYMPPDGEDCQLIEHIPDVKISDDHTRRALLSIYEFSQVVLVMPSVLRTYYRIR